jgi:hypothetical protein
VQKELFQRGGLLRAPAFALGVIALLPAALAGVAGLASASDAPASPPASAAPNARPTSTVILLRPPVPASSVTIGRSLPDPTPLIEKTQWVYDLKNSNGDLYLLGIHRVELPSPQSTPRALGRFAFELYEGATLLERARFDFPMLGDGQSPGGTSDAGTKLPIGGRAPSFAKISSRIGVMFPASTRGTRIEIVDRATDRRWTLPWPPMEMTAISDVESSSTDAGPSGGG